MFSSAASMLALWRADGLEAILVLAAIGGLTSELYRPSTTALLSAIVDEEHRVTAFGLYGLATNAGLTIGPALGGLLAEHSFGALFVIDAVSSAICGAIALHALPDAHRASPRPGCRRRALRAIARDRVLLRFLIVLTLTNMLLFQAQTTLPLWIRDLGFSSTIYGALLALNGGLNATLQLPISALSRRLAQHRAITVGCTLIAIGFGVTGLVHTVVLLFAAVFVWTLGELIVWPLGAAYVASRAPQGLAGRYAGARSLTFALGLVLAPIIGIPLFTWTPVALGAFSLLAGLLAAMLSVTLRSAAAHDRRTTTAITPTPAAQASQSRSA